MNDSQRRTSPFDTCNLTGREKFEKTSLCRSAKRRQNKRENGNLIGREGRIKEKMVIECGNECYWFLNSYTFIGLRIMGLQINLEFHDAHTLGVGMDKGC